MTNTRNQPGIRPGDVDLILRKLDNLKTLIEDQASKRMLDSQKRAKLNTDQTQKYLGISRTALYRLTAEGKIPYTKVGGRRRFQISDLDKYLEGEYHAELPSIL
jgi:excisionase family DNA binding protein